MTKLPYLASGASLWRGYDYYTAHKVLSWEPTEPGGYPQQFDGVVSGNGDKPYEVHIDIAHPKKSTCTCPFAEGRHVICKHMVALYFTIYPAEADELLHAQEQWEAEEVAREEAHRAETWRYVKGLKKAELQEELYRALLEIDDLRDRRRWW